MSNPTASTPLNAEIAAILSQLAYQEIGVTVPGCPIPAGWSEISNVIENQEELSIAQLLVAACVKVGPGTAVLVNQFRVFMNADTNQIVIAFKGSSPPNLLGLAFGDANFAENWYSDLFNSGYSAYVQISAVASRVLADLKTQFPTTTFFTDGHSLGGGMAQDFALQNNLSGYGQNALPVSQAVIDKQLGLPITATPTAEQISQVISGYRKSQQFIETDVSGDIATLKYDLLAGQPYLDSTPTILPSPKYNFTKELEEIGAGVLGLITPVSGSENITTELAGGGIITGLIQAGEAHLLTTFIPTGNQYPILPNGRYAVPTAPAANPNNLQINSTPNGITVGTNGSAITISSPTSASTSDELLTSSLSGDSNSSTGEIVTPNISSAPINGNEWKYVTANGSYLDETFNTSTGEVEKVSYRDPDGATGTETYGSNGSIAQTETAGPGVTHTFQFVVPQNGYAPATDTIQDLSGNGTLVVIGNDNSTTTLGTGLTQTSNFIWDDNNGVQYQFTPGSGASLYGSGTLNVTGGILGAGNEVIIQGFNLGLAASSQSGFLGIYVPESLTLSNNPAPGGNNISEESSQSFSLSLGAPNANALSVSITIAGANPNDFQIDTGSGAVSFVNGVATVRIPAGQNNFQFFLDSIEPDSQSATVQLTAAISPPNLPAITSNTISLNYSPESETPPQAPQTSGTFSFNHWEYFSGYGDGYAAGQMAYGAVPNYPGPNPNAPGEANVAYFSGDGQGDSITTSDSMANSQAASDSIPTVSGIEINDEIGSNGSYVSGNDVVVTTGTLATGVGLGNGNNVITAESTGGTNIGAGTGNNVVQFDVASAGNAVTLGNGTSGDGNNFVTLNENSAIVLAGDGNNRARRDAPAGRAFADRNRWTAPTRGSRANQ